MEDDSSEGVVDNVVKGPWKSPKLKKVSIETKKLAEDMMLSLFVNNGLLAVFVFALAYLQYALMSQAADHYTVDLKVKLLRSLLRQDVGYLE